MVFRLYLRVARATNFIIIIGPMATHSSYWRPCFSMSSSNCWVTMPWKPSEPSSVAMKRFVATERMTSV